MGCPPLILKRFHGEAGGLTACNSFQDWRVLHITKANTVFQGQHSGVEWQREFAGLK